MSAPPVVPDRASPSVPALRDLPLRAARERRRVPRAVRRTLVVVALLVLWQVLAEIGVLTPDTLSSPLDTIRTAGDMFASGDLDTALLTSLQRAATGLALGVPVGLVLALASGLLRLGEDVIDSPMQMLRTLPFLGITPLLILWFGIGDTPKIALVFLGVCFPVYVNTLVGIRNVDARLVEAARTFGAGRWSVIRSVVLPGALPNILVGLRLALGIAWLALVVGEQISSDGGIGSLMLQAQDNLRTDRIVVCLVIYALLGLISDLVVRVLERVLLTWRQGLEAS
ncbi:ABC transporter permease [Actinomycetospora endophytica]|uniref:ABC transporter permease n=1 Tax=Actinomycetospora endophytica TaxID=2291215 RepID=A0ABS8PIT4_9PSEU|nr:ABC transporter permease [Actinomycetospora endophytica]MCD2197953.1 ABC transporter permease [Actinomycetospora endophytica]